MKSSDSGKEKKLSDGAFPGEIPEGDNTLSDNAGQGMGNEGKIPEATADDYQPGTDPNSGELQIPEADGSEAQNVPLHQRPNVGRREEVEKPRDPGDGMN